MGLDIQSTTADGVTEVKVEGSVDLYSAPQLRKSILDSVPEAAECVLVNLDGVSYMDSSGVAVLVEGLRSARKHDKKYVLLHPSKSVMKVLELARLDTVFEITPQ